MKTIKILVTNNFTNDNRVLKEALTFSKKKFKVEIIALYDENLKEEEYFDDIKVTRLKLKTRKWSKSKPIQFIKYLEFCFTSYKLSKKSDIIFCVDLSTLPIGSILKKLNNKIKVIYDSHEYAINCIPNESKISIKIKYYLEKFFIKNIDQVINVSESIALKYKELYKIEKPHVILNCPNNIKLEKSNTLRDIFKIESNKTIFITQGFFVKGRGIENILSAFIKIKDKNNVIIFMGYGPLQEEIIKQSKINSNIYFQKAVSPTEIIKYTSSADIGISLIENLCLSYYYCLPNKFFEYIISELPVIVSNLPEMKKIVEEYNIGVAIENNYISLIKAIEESNKLKTEKIKDNLQTVKSIFNWEVQEKKLIKIIENI